MSSNDPWQLRPSSPPGTDSPAEAPSSTDPTPLETTPLESRAASPAPHSDWDAPPASSASPQQQSQHPLAVAQAAAAAAAQSGAPQSQDELAAFRREWEEEVRQRRDKATAAATSRSTSAQKPNQPAEAASRGAQHGPKNDAANSREASQGDHVGEVEDDDNEDDDEDEYGVGRPHSPSRVAGLIGDQPILGAPSSASMSAGQPSKSASTATSTSAAVKQPTRGTEASKAQVHNAVEAYAHAVQCERKGELDEALKFYRRAFRINQEADQLYQRAHVLLDQGIATGSAKGGAPHLSANDAILAAPEIASKVRAAIDFEDVRRAEVLQHEERSRALAKGKGKKVEADEKGGADGSGQVPQTLSPKAKRRRSMELGTAPPPQTQVNVSSPASAGQSIDTLSALFEKATLSGGVGEEKADLANVHFMPLDEERAVPLAMLPDEVLLHVLHCLAAPHGRRGAKIAKPKADPNAAAAAAENRAKTAAAAAAAAATNDAPQDHQQTALTTAPTPTRKPAHGIGVVIADPDWKSVEQLARSCWKWRVLIKHSGLWQMIVRETYWPPQIAPDLSLKDLCLAHGGDWRTTFVNQPRVRLNGVYIAACHYTRPGMHEENIWVRVVHVVEFFRTLRFLPDGRALSLLTTEKPAETVRKMEPSFKSKGFAVGRWSLHPSGLPDDEYQGREPGAKVLIEDLKDGTLEKYAFRMVFALKQTKRGKMDKLVMLDYQSINLHTAEVLPLPQKHARPFHFSVVRSY